MKTAELLVLSEQGLHARPADLFIRLTNTFSSAIQIKNRSTGSDFVNAKSILRLLSLGIYKNHLIEIQAEGVDEQKAIESLSNVINGNFSE